MRLLFTLIFTFTLVCVSFSQDNMRSGNPVSHAPNAPYIVSGPPVESTNQISESFEGTTFPPAGWTTINVTAGTGWSRITVGTTPVPGFNGGDVTAPPAAGSGTAMAFINYLAATGSSNDFWLISPQLMTVGPGDTLSFWMRKFGNYVDHLDVRISTTVNNNPAAFNTVVQNISLTAADSGWVYRSYQIGNMVPAGSNIYIGLREWVTDNFVDGASFFIELFRAGGPYTPVELSSFNATSVNGIVNLNWATATETNNRGFEVQRKLAGSEFAAVAFVDGNGTTSDVKNYSFTDRTITSGSYIYRLKQVDFNGASEYSNEVEVEVSAPSAFTLDQNYPNPFNPSTIINFSLAVDSKVSLKVFDILGQEVASLINSELAAGPHTLNFDASAMNSGIYFYQMDASGIDGTAFSSVKKMILTK